ncbi:MAG TPA: family 20 glycosylhydrolase, partial [Gemmatimonadaceae bacterium]|nr:family 20 glycosylhydrolase [Gemmatimonadaceae bacterium]
LRRRLIAPAVRVTDSPRYPWRGAMLDVSRHFLEVADVKRYIDVMALYKLNRLHLHLSDDQGWRIEITSWPNLARHGGSTEVGGGPGGFYTQAELRDLVHYARERFIEIVPEIDVPGHTNAALASYPELNCDSIAPPLYTGIRVGFSALCVSREEPYRFLADVVREIGAITGPWFHIGGDEVERLTHAQYLQFIERAQSIVRGAGKTMIGWGEIAPAALDRETIVQHWRKDSSFVHAARGGRVIVSAGPKMYLDMKYDSTTILGLQWAGRIEVRDSYDWDPATYLPSVSPDAVLGVEAPLWSETLEKREDFEFMAFPRLVAVAEVGWSKPEVRAWDGFRLRLAAHGPRLAALGVNYYRSPQVPWVR